jgi:hypothetical protein
MAMHKPRKQMRFQDGGDVNEAEMKQRGLDISNRARESGTESTSFFQRLREGNIDDPNSAAYKKYGAGRARLDDQIAAAKEKLAGEVQEKVAANKTSDGDVSEYDRRVDAAASAPSRAPTLPARPGQGVAMAKPRMTKPAAKKEETSVESAVMAGEARRRQKSAVINDEDRKRQNSRSAVMTDEARKRKAGKEAAFQRAQAEAKTPEGKAKLDERIKGQALERYTPEAELIGGAALKPLSALAKRLAKPKIQEYNPTMLPAPKAAAKAETKSLPAPQQKLSYDKGSVKAAERTRRAEGRKTEMQKDNDARSGVDTTSKSYSPSRNTSGESRFNIGRGATRKSSTEVINVTPKSTSSKSATQKRNPRLMSEKNAKIATLGLGALGTGAVAGAYAAKMAKEKRERDSEAGMKKGGSVSSASKRADGIAQRGKTRGKVY